MRSALLTAVSSLMLFSAAFSQESITVTFDRKTVGIPVPTGYKVLAPSSELYKNMSSSFSGNGKVLGLFIPDNAKENDPDSINSYCIIAFINQQNEQRYNKAEFADFKKKMRLDMFSSNSDFKKGIQDSVEKQNQRLGGNYITLSDYKLSEQAVDEPEYLVIACGYTLHNVQRDMSVDISIGQAFFRIHNRVIMANMFFSEKKNLSILRDDLAVWVSRILKANWLHSDVEETGYKQAEIPQPARRHSNWSVEISRKAGEIVGCLAIILAIALVFKIFRKKKTPSEEKTSPFENSGDTPPPPPVE